MNDPSSDPGMTTRVLVDRAQDGDRQALNELLDRYLPRVMRVVRMKRGPFLGQRLEDHDLAQEVLIRVWRSLDTYDPTRTASFLLWVTRLAENGLRDLARRQRAAKRYAGPLMSLDQEREDGRPEGASHPLVTSTPSRLVSRTEDHAILDSSVATLDRTSQDLLVLRYYYDLPLEEVGAEFDLGSEAARSRIRRALGKLRGILMERGVEDASDPADLIRRSF